MEGEEEVRLGEEMREGGEWRERRDLMEVVHVQCARHALSPIPLSP